ncbi:conjugal transfer protein TrbL [Promicromonospora soli]
MSLCDNPVVGGLCDDVGQAVSAANPLAGLGEAMGGITEFAIRGMWSLMDSTTLVDLRAEHFGRVYDLVFGIAVVVMLGFFLLQVIGGMIRREPGALARGLTGLAKSVLGSFVVLALTATLLEVVDRLCLGIVDAAGTTMERMEMQLLAAATAGTIATHLPGGTGALLSLFLTGLAAGAAFITWMSLLIRKALLLISVVFAPLALAGATWEATRGWVARWAQLVVALVLSKLVLVVVFLLATSMLSAPLEADLASVSEPLTGVVLLLLAGFAPYMTYRAISFIGFDLYQSMHAEQEAKQALNRPMPFVPNMSQRAAPPSVLRGEGGSASGGSGTAGGTTSTALASGGTGAAGSQTAGAAGAARGATGAASASAGSAGAMTGAAAAPVVLGAMAAKAALTAGPQAGSAVGEGAGQQIDAAQSGSSSSSGGDGRGRRPNAAPLPASASAAGQRDVPSVLRERGGKR